MTAQGRAVGAFSGTVVDSQGAPPARAILGLEEWGEGRSGGSTRSLPSDGRFTLKDLLPGEYVVAAKTGTLGDDRAPGESAHVRIRIDDSDVEGVSLALVRTVRVRGRLVFENEPAPRPQGSGFMVKAVPLDLVDVPNVAQSTAVKPDLTFELTGIEGPSAIAMSNVPAGWVVQSVKYRGREITDSVTPFGDSGETVALEILLSRRGGTLSGTVLDDAGAPATGSRVLLFPADSAKWRTSPPARSAFASSKGRFEFEARRAGENLVAAASAEEIPPFPKAEFFERLSRVAERVVLGEGERRSIDLRVVKVPEAR